MFALTPQFTHNSVSRCCVRVCRGAPMGEGPGLPLGPEKHYIFRVSSVKLRYLHFLSLFFEAFCCVGGLKKAAAW